MIEVRWRRLLLWFALALAIAAPIAPEVLAQSAAMPKRLRALAGDASAQFKLAYRQRPGEGQAREEQLVAVIAAWQQSTPSDANNELLERWLRTTIRSSMPGSRTALPAAPDFTKPAVTRVEGSVVVHSPEPSPATELKSSAADKSAGDPFSDDPDWHQ
jgi:hypothetical protein